MGEPIQILWSTKVQVVHNGQTTLLPLIITGGRGPTMLGTRLVENARDGLADHLSSKELGKL